MKWLPPWRRDPAAVEAQRSADADLERARARRPAVEREARRLRETQRRNQFAAMIEQALRGGTS